MPWKMTPQNRAIAKRMITESPTRIAQETGLTRVRVYQIFKEYARHCLFDYEFGAGGIDRLRHYLKLGNV